MPAMADDGADVEDGERVAGEEGDRDGEEVDEGGPTSRYLVSAAAGERLRRPPPPLRAFPLFPIPHRGTHRLPLRSWHPAESRDPSRSAEA